MSADAVDRSASMERLSALMDGELAGAAVPQACAQWREDVAARSSWHAYQLIGDVLRSEDLASSAQHHTDFLCALRLRLAQEPVVLAPQPVITPRRGGRWSWAAGCAVAAGFVAVAGVVTMLRNDGAVPAPAVAVAQPVPVPAPNPEPQLFVANAQFIHDARLDRYLAAHQEFAGSSALGVPSAYLRSATLDASKR